MRIRDIICEKLEKYHSGTPTLFSTYRNFYMRIIYRYEGRLNINRGCFLNVLRHYSSTTRNIQFYFST